MPFPAKFTLLPQNIQDKIIHRARTQGAYAAANEFWQESGMTYESLYEKLRKMVNPKKEKPPEEIQKRGSQKYKEPEKVLSAEENVFLDKLTNGEVSISEMSRFVGRQVFEKMLKNPNDIRFIDFFRSELLRQKEDDSKIKDQWAKEIIARFFAGKLPPRFCPKCGEDLSVTQNSEPIPENKDEEEVKDA